MTTQSGISSLHIVPPHLAERVQAVMRANPDQLLMLGMNTAPFICTAVAVHLGKRVGALDGNARLCLESVLNGMLVQAGQVDPSLRELLEFLFQYHDQMADKAEKEVAEQLKREAEPAPEPRRPGWLRRLVRWMW